MRRDADPPPVLRIMFETIPAGRRACRPLYDWFQLSMGVQTTFSRLQCHALSSSIIELGLALSLGHKEGTQRAAEYCIVIKRIYRLLHLKEKGGGKAYIYTE